MGQNLNYPRTLSIYLEQASIFTLISKLFEHADSQILSSDGSTVISWAEVLCNTGLRAH